MVGLIAVADSKHFLQRMTKHVHVVYSQANKPHVPVLLLLIARVALPAFMSCVGPVHYMLSLLWLLFFGICAVLEWRTSWRLAMRNLHDSTVQVNIVSACDVVWQARILALTMMLRIWWCSELALRLICKGKGCDTHWRSVGGVRISLP